MIMCNEYPQVRGVGGMSTFIPGTILLNGMISKDAGTMNGLNDSLCALGRALAPSLSGALFAASTRHAQDAPFPFDRHLPFYNICLLALVALVISLRLGGCRKGSGGGVT